MTGIAKKYRVSVPELKRWNLLRSKNKIYRGQRLKVYISTADRLSKRGTKNPSSLPNFKPPANIQAGIKKFILQNNLKFPGVLWKLKNSIVTSTQYGRVIEKGYLRGYGRYVIIDHGRGWLSFYSNLSRIFVNNGSKISTGVRIGTAKNKKLFFSISHHGKPLNPVKILNRAKRNFEPS